MNFLLLALLRAGQLGMIAADEADMSSLCGIERDNHFVAVSLTPTSWVLCSTGWSSDYLCPR